MANADTRPLESDTKSNVSETISRALADDADGGTFETCLNGVVVEVYCDAFESNGATETHLHISVVVDNITAHTPDNYLGVPTALVDVSNQMDHLAADLSGLVNTHTQHDHRCEFRRANTNTNDLETVIYKDTIVVRD